MCDKTSSTPPMQADTYCDPPGQPPTPSLSRSSDKRSTAATYPRRSRLSHLDLSPPSTYQYPPLFDTPSRRNDQRSPFRLTTTSPPFQLIPSQTLSQEIGSPPFPIWKKKTKTPCDPLVPLTTRNKSSGIARQFARLHLRPQHPLLHAYPRPLSSVALPALSLSTRPPPSLRRYLSRQTGATEHANLRQSGPLLRHLLSPLPHLHLLRHPHLLLHDTAGNVAAQGISSQDVQL